LADKQKADQERALQLLQEKMQAEKQA